MSNHIVVFWIIFGLLLFTIVYCDKKYNMLRDEGTASIKAYSWSRVQLAWWVLIVLAAFITIILSYAGHPIPTLDSSTLILLGITTGTTAAARLIDVSDRQNPNLTNTLQDQKKESFFLDILSDCNGVSMNRLQAVIFNFVFGAWFISYVLQHFADPSAALFLTVNCAISPAAAKECAAQPWNYIIPVMSQNNLILLGLSSATYAALKATENSPTAKGIAENQQSGALPNNNQPNPAPNSVQAPPPAPDAGTTDANNETTTNQ
ncbi:MAG: hypothetical protein JWQ38_1248 [Flavipsychrobacter sp.]|nr:hypothetical protein [Flavipsychrobacter sp.]